MDEKARGISSKLRIKGDSKMISENFKVNDKNYRVKIPEPSKMDFRIEAVLPGEQALRFHDLFIVKSFNESTKETRYDLTVLDTKANNHVVLATIFAGMK